MKHNTILRFFFLFVLILVSSVSVAEIKIDGLNYELDYENKTAAVVRNESASGDIVIPPSVVYEGVTYKVTSLGGFFLCSDLSSVVIPEGVTYIGFFAFYGCTNLTSITIPSSVKVIGESTFQGCEKLTSVTIPAGVKVIENSTFCGCKSLTSVIIPDSVTSIGTSAFYGCANLSSVVIPSSVEHLDRSAFFECPNLKTVGSIGSGCNIEIGWETTILSFVFAENTSLTSLEVPDNVRYIEKNAFQGCSGLQTVTLPSSMWHIDCLAFWNCSNLTTVICKSSRPPLGDPSVFYGVDISKCKLIVPEGSAEAYRAVSPWNEFNIVENTTTSIQGTFADNADMSGSVYTLDGKLIRKNVSASQMQTELPKGIYIVGDKKVLVK